MISRRYQPASASNSIPLAREDSSSSSEDEEEEERLVSQEPPTTQNNSKKRQTDADIANDLNTGTVKPKKPRMVLTSAKLTGPDGFLKIRHNFPSQVKYRPPKSLKKDSKRKLFERDIHASAVYIGKLMQAYQQFAIDIAPNMHYNDAFIKIRDLGSKKDVKDHVNMMRQEVCKAHLEKVYGREKAERFVDELEHGFRTGEKETVDEFELMERDTGRGVAQRLANLVGENDDEEEVNNDGSEKESEKQDNSLNASATTTGNEKAVNSTMQDSDDDEEMEANFDDVSPTPANDASNDHATTTDDNVSNVEESKDSPKDSDDEEEEATFDDLAVPSEKPVQAEQENSDVANEADDSISEEAAPQVVLEEAQAETEEKEKEANEATTNNELEQSQDSISMSQESMVFDATQDTMIMDSTQADLSATQEIATQDTLVEDVSQTQPTQLLEDLGNSQDY